MLLILLPAHSPLFATTLVLPCKKEQARPGPHAWSSPKTNVSVTSSDLGVILDTLLSSTFSSYSLYSQVLSILQKHHSNPSTALQLCQLYPSLSSESLWFCHLASWTILHTLAEAVSCHLTCQLETLQCLLIALKKKPKPLKRVQGLAGPTLPCPSLTVVQAHRLSLASLRLSYSPSTGPLH